MSAKNGSTRSFRLLGCLIAAALLVAAFGASAASAKKAKPPVKSTYLALGDSLAFGYSQQLYNEGVEAGFDNPEAFEHGYANELWIDAHGEANGVRLQNDGCPGETTTSLIGSSLATQLNKATPLKESQEKSESLPITGVETPPASAPNCLYQEAWNGYKLVGTGGPLHHSYGGKSQLEDALATIKTKQNVEKQPVTTITLDIGPNDELHAVKAVEKEVEAKVEAIAKKEVQAKYVEPVVFAELEEKYVEPAVNAALQEKYIGPAVFQKCHEKAVAETGNAEPETEEKTNECLANEGQALGEQYEAEHAAFLEKEGKQIGGEYFLAHKTELGEKGEVLGYEYFVAHEKELTEKGVAYGHQYAFEHAAALQAEAETKITELAKGEGAYAGKGLFEQIDSNLAGILYALRHGSSFGGVDYTGAISFLVAYNPYGKLFKTAAEASSFVEAHGGLAGPFLSEDTGGAIHPAFNALAAVLAAQLTPTVTAYSGCTTNVLPYFNPGTKKEPKRLQQLTNMANGTITDGKYDGPDIHPTPKGYSEIAKLMHTSCNSSLARKATKHSKKK